MHSNIWWFYRKSSFFSYPREDENHPDLARTARCPPPRSRYRGILPCIQHLNGAACRSSKAATSLRVAVQPHLVDIAARRPSQAQRIGASRGRSGLIVHHNAERGSMSKHHCRTRRCQCHHRGRAHQDRKRVRRNSRRNRCRVGRRRRQKHPGQAISLSGPVHLRPALPGPHLRVLHVRDAHKHFFQDSKRTQWGSPSTS